MKSSIRSSASIFDEKISDANDPLDGADCEIDDSTVPINPLDEKIAAYLDDELSSEERAAFERRLADDVDLRRRVDEERSAWDALELLDAEPPNATLAETTVDRLNSETRTELETLERAKTRRRRLRRAANYGIAGLLALVGFFFFSQLFPDVRTLRERDCRVVERLAQLEAVGDFEYLTALDESNLFSEPRSTSLFDGFNPSLGKPTFPGTPPQAKPLDAAPEFGAALPAKSTAPKTFAELSQDRVFYRLQQKFERLDPTTRQNRRDFYRQIASAPNAEQLWRVLDNYCDWISAWPNENDCERLLTLPIERRVAEIRRLLTPFYRPFGAFAQQRPEEPASAAKMFETTPTIKALRSALPEELRTETLVPLYQKYADFLQKRGRERAGEQRREGILAFLTETPNDDLLAGLSSNAQKYFARLSEEERMSALGLLVSLSVCEEKERSAKETRPFQKKFGRGFDGPSNAFGNRKIDAEFEPFRGDSISELAELLRNSPQEVRDFLTSRPAAEMRGRLWAIHWGFAQFAGPAGVERGARPSAPPTTQSDDAPRFVPRLDESAAPLDSSRPTPLNARPF